MTLYEAVLSAPDTATRQEALNKLCREKVAEGMRDALFALNLSFAEARVEELAAELEKALYAGI